MADDGNVAHSACFGARRSCRCATNLARFGPNSSRRSGAPSTTPMPDCCARSWPNSMKPTRDLIERLIPTIASGLWTHGARISTSRRSTKSATSVREEILEELETGDGRGGCSRTVKSDDASNCLGPRRSGPGRDPGKTAANRARRARSASLLTRKIPPARCRPSSSQCRRTGPWAGDRLHARTPRDLPERFL